MGSSTNAAKQDMVDRHFALDQWRCSRRYRALASILFLWRDAAQVRLNSPNLPQPRASPALPGQISGKHRLYKYLLFRIKFVVGSETMPRHMMCGEIIEQGPGDGGFADASLVRAD